MDNRYLSITSLGTSSMSHLRCLELSELSDDCSLVSFGDCFAGSSCCKDLETVSSKTILQLTFAVTSQLASSLATAAAVCFLFLFRHVGLLDRTSFQIWSRWLIGWSGSTESHDFSLTKQQNTLVESRSRVTAFSRSISCLVSCFTPANVVGSDSCLVLSAIFCSITFNCSLANFKSELHKLFAVESACKNKFTVLAYI